MKSATSRRPRAAARRAAQQEAIPRERVPLPAWPSVLAGAAALALYLSWCPAAAGDKDSPEFVVVLATLGLAHPTGYPLYTLLGHAFVSAAHAAGIAWALAANAWSALGGALAVGLLHALAARLLAVAGVRGRAAWLAALLPVAAFAANPVWTVETTVAEVNSWHLAWVAGATLFAVSALRRDPKLSDRTLMAGAVWWGLLCGAGLAHHRTSVWVMAPLTLALLARLRPAKPLAWLAAIAGALLPLSAYGYVAWRGAHPAAAQWPAFEAGGEAFWEFVSGAGYAHYLGRFAPADSQRVLLAKYVFPWLAPALLSALVWPFTRSPAPRALRAGLAAVVLMQTLYAFTYGVPDPVSYFLPSLALGLAVIPAVLAGFAPVRRFGHALATAAGLGVVAAGWTWPGVATGRAATFDDLERLSRSMWASIRHEQGFVLWEDDMWYRIRGYQLLEGEKPGLVVLNPVLLKHPRARRTFAAQHGFDPLDGLSEAELAVPGTGAELEPLRKALVDRLKRTGLPVVVVLPQAGSVRQLSPGGEAAGQTPAAR